MCCRQTHEPAAENPAPGIGGASPPTPQPHVGAPAPATGNTAVASAAVENSNQNIVLTPEQTAKLQSELDVVQANMSVLNEMLTELTPGQEHPSDLELLTVRHQPESFSLIQSYGNFSDTEAGSTTKT